MQTGGDASAFKAALARWASGVTVVTCQGAGGEPVGFTATSFSSVSLDPPLVLVCLDQHAESHVAFARADFMTISVLAAGQGDVAMRMAKRGAGKFEGVVTRRGARTGGLLVEGALATLECRMHARLDGGDHTILVGEVLEAAVSEGEPLLYYQRRFGGFQATLFDRPHGCIQASPPPARPATLRPCDTLPVAPRVYTALHAMESPSAASRKVDSYWSA